MKNPGDETEWSNDGQFFSNQKYYLYYWASAFVPQAYSVQNVFECLMKSLLYLLYLMTLLWLGMVLFGSSSSLVKGHEGQCAFADRCCVGRDSSCVVNGLQSNGQMVDHPCYCDEGCLETGDCCLDYEQVCNVQCKCNFLLLLHQ